MLINPNNVFRCLVAAALCAGVAELHSQPLDFSTVAGNAGYGSVDGMGTNARFHFPQGVAVDPFGTVYVADSGNSVIRRIGSSGIVTTFAGTAGNAGSADATGTNASFSLPQGIATDAHGNVYVADTANDIIRMITPEGAVSTIAGSPRVIGSSNGIGSQALFNLPSALALDSAGNIYVVDTYNSTIRMLAQSGTNWVVTTLAGSPGVAANVDATNAAARFNLPAGISADGSGRLYVADTGNNAIRQIVPSGTNWVTTSIAGVVQSPLGISADAEGNLFATCANDTIVKRAAGATNWTVLAGTVNLAGSRDGASNALFNFPQGIAFATNGELIVADALNNTVRRVTLSGDVSTVAGLAGGAGAADGSGVTARFNAPTGLAIDGAGNLYIADSANNTIRRRTPAGMVTTLAGVATNPPGSIDGLGTNAAFNSPMGLALDANENIYVADTENNQIRRMTLTTNGWMVSTLAGRAGTVYYGAITNYGGTITNVVAGAAIVGTAFSTTPTYVNYSGAITNISGHTTNLQIVITNTAIFTNVVNHVTNVITLAGNSFTLAPIAESTNFSQNGEFINYSGIVTNGGIAEIIVTNIPFIIAGTNPDTKLPITNFFSVNTFTLPPAPPLLDGVGSNALFYRPAGIALDQLGNIYVADGGTNGIRNISADGTVTTLGAAAGAYSVSPAVFGTNQLFYHCTAAVFGPDGALYIADANNDTIRKLPPGGAPITIAGSPGIYGTSDGTNADARFASPVAIAVDSRTNLFVADAAGETIRELSPMGANWVVTTVGGLPSVPGTADGLGASARFNSPGGLALDGSGDVFVADTGNNTIRWGQPAGLAAPPPVPIRIVVSAPNQVVISWPASAGGFVLETTASPTSSAWTPVAPTPVQSGNQMMVTNSTSSTAAFYRLRH